MDGNVSREAASKSETSKTALWTVSLVETGRSRAFSRSISSWTSRRQHSTNTAPLCSRHEVPSSSAAIKARRARLAGVRRGPPPRGESEFRFGGSASFESETRSRLRRFRGDARRRTESWLIRPRKARAGAEGLGLCRKAGGWTGSGVVVVISSVDAFERARSRRTARVGAILCDEERVGSRRGIAAGVCVPTTGASPADSMGR